MKLFGLTGGLASGKSTVSRIFAEAGVPVIDADLIARQIVEPGSEGLEAVVQAFGAGVVDPSGGLDRRAMAKRVFDDASARAKLSAILHPRIASRTAEQSAALAAEGHRLACYDAALIVENGLADAFRPLVVVAAPVHMQMSRAMARDGLSRAEVEGRLSAQMPLARKTEVADYLIDNSGSLERTRSHALEVLNKIRANLT